MKELTELLEKLANKLGTTVEHLWGVLLKQTKIVLWEMVAYTIVAGLFAIAAIYSITFTLKGLENLPQSRTPYSDGIKDDEIGYTILLIVSIIYLVTVPFILISNIKKIATLKSNPEYWALQEVLSAISE